MVPQDAQGPRARRLYRPHGFSELKGLVPAPVLSALDPERVYGVAWSGRIRVRKVSNAQRVRETLGREEWIGVPVDLTGSGLNRLTVDAARGVIQGNTRPRKVGDRFFELAHGPLTCAHCGCRMTGFGRRSGKNPSYAYRCNSPSRRGTDCPNRHQHHADALEHAAVSMFETYASSGKLLELFEAAIVEQDRRSGRGSGLIERRNGLMEQLKELEDERLAYLRQNARGVLSDAELDCMLSEVNERRDTIMAEVRRAEDAADLEREREAVRETLAKPIAASYNPVHAEWYEDPDAVHPSQYLSIAAAPEEIRRAYLKTGARFSVDRHGTLTLELDPLQSGRTHTEMSYGSSTRTGS